MLITREKINQARNADLIAYCDYKDFEMKPEGDGNYRLNRLFRLNNQG